MKGRSLEELFIDELKDVYDAEKQITKALPKMIKLVQSEELSAALAEHLEETQVQLQRLDKVFSDLDIRPGRKKCAGMQGIIEEGNAMLEKIEDDDVKDAAIICSSQKVEHYEMAAYGCLRTWAQLLGYEEVAARLQENLDEEGSADKKLTKLAESLNLEAVGAEDDSQQR